MERPGPPLPPVPETDLPGIVAEEPASPSAGQDEDAASDAAPLDEVSTGTKEAPATQQPGAGADGENEEDRDEDPRPA